MSKSRPKPRAVRPARKSIKTKRGATSAKPQRSEAVKKISKIDQIIAALRSAKGASVPDLMAVTGWQQHSIRGVLAGAVKKRGHTITSSKTGAERIYRIGGKP